LATFDPAYPPPRITTLRIQDHNKQRKLLENRKEIPRLRAARDLAVAEQEEIGDAKLGVVRVLEVVAAFVASFEDVILEHPITCTRSNITEFHLERKGVTMVLTKLNAFLAGPGVILLDPSNDILS